MGQVVSRSGRLKHAGRDRLEKVGDDFNARLLSRVSLTLRESRADKWRTHSNLQNRVATGGLKCVPPLLLPLENCLCARQFSGSLLRNDAGSQTELSQHFFVHRALRQSVREFCVDDRRI
jgi:hypothetical protein